jgi:hypothetical protein
MLEWLEARLVPVTMLPIADQVVVEGQPLTFKVAAKPTLDIESPKDFVYELARTHPGATLDPVTGVFNWTPAEDNGADGFNFTVRVTDPRVRFPADLGGFRPDTAIATFHVQVLEAGGEAPVLAPIPNQSVVRGNAVVVQAVAKDDDIPPNPVAFSLTAAPGGASIDPISGVFDWKPAATQAPGSYSVTVRATGTGDAPLFAETSFQIMLTVPTHVAPVAAPVVPANPNNTLVAILASSATTAATLAGHGTGGILLQPPSALGFGPFPVKTLAGLGGFGIGSLTFADVEVSPTQLGTPVEVPLEQIQYKTLHLSQTEENTDGSSVERLYTDFLGPAPSLENSVMIEGEPALSDKKVSEKVNVHAGPMPPATSAEEAEEAPPAGPEDRP